MTLAELIQWSLLAVLTLVVIVLLRHIAVLTQRLSPILGQNRRADPLASANGTSLASISLFDTAGEPREIPDQRDLVILIVRPGCRACSRLLGALPGLLEHSTAGAAELVVVVRSRHVTAGVKIRHQHRLPATVNVLADTDEKVVSTWGVSTTPYLLVVSGPDQHIQYRHPGVSEQFVGKVLSQRSTSPSEGQ